MDTSNIWDQVLSRVEGRKNRFVFSAWFRPTRFVSDDGVELRVSVPNALFRDWFLKHYAPIVDETLAELEHGGRIVRYVTDQATASAPSTSGLSAH